MTDPIVPVILSGGSGTRLWPVSSEAKPKQLHALTGDATMLQATAGRVLDATRFARPIVVSSERHADEVEAQLTAVGVEPSALILEPTGRNTAAAIALAALEAEPSALLLVMPSDHVIGRPDLFLSSVDRAAPFARQGYIVTFGITPHFPETGYGYIQRGDPLGDEVFLVARFVEKPARSTADEFLRAGTYCWNGGIFLFEAGRIIAALEAHAPDILVSVRQSLDNADRHGTRVHPWPDQFTRTRSQSIDHAVLEVDDRVAVARVQMDWSDVGSWDAIYDLLGKDDAGNQVAGQAIAIDTRRCLLRSGGPIIVTVGIEDLIVVATADGILIMPRGQSQRIKEATALIGSSAKLAPP